MATMEMESGECLVSCVHKLVTVTCTVLLKYKLSQVENFDTMEMEKNWRWSMEHGIMIMIMNQKTSIKITA